MESPDDSRAVFDETATTEQGNGEAFLFVLRHALAEHASLNEGALGEGTRVAGAVKALRLVCQEARRIVNAFVTRLKVEPSPNMDTVLTAASDMFPLMDCLTVEVLGLRSQGFKRWVQKLDSPTPAEESHPLPPVEDKDPTFVTWIATFLRMAMHRRAGNQADSAQGRQQQTKQALHTSSQDDAQLQHLIHALRDPACSMRLAKLKHLSVQAAAPHADRASPHLIAQLSASLLNLPSLQQLRLLKTTTSPAALAPLAAHPSLRHLILYNCDLSQGLGPLANLTRLDAGLERKPGPQTSPACTPSDLTPLTGLRQLRGMGWVLDAAALAQLAALPQLTYLEALRLCDTLTPAAAATQLPAQPALRHLHLTAFGTPGILPSSINLISQLWGRSLGTWHGLRVDVSSSTAQAQAAVCSSLGVLAELLRSCKLPQLHLGSSARLMDLEHGQPGDLAPHLARLLSACLPGPQQQRQVGVLSLQGLDVTGADMPALLECCRCCGTLRLRGCGLDGSALAQLHLLPCAHLELWRCSALRPDSLIALLVELGIRAHDSPASQGGPSDQQRNLGMLHSLSIRCLKLNEEEVILVRAAARDLAPGLALDITAV